MREEEKQAKEPQSESIKEGREKFWDKLTDRQKIERMRGIVKRLMDLNVNLEKQVCDLMNHGHDNYARLVAPIGKGYGGGIVSHFPGGIYPLPKKEDGVYF